MKRILKSMLVVIYFLVLQTVVSAGVIVFKLLTDQSFVDSMIEAGEEGFDFAASAALTSELVLPAVIITDLILIIPLLFKSKFSMFKKVRTHDAIDLVAVGLTLNLFISFLVSLIDTLPIADDYNELMEFSLNGDVVFMILSAGVLAPLVEELVFRYWIFDICKEKSETFKIVISALLFGFAHLNLIQSSYAFLMGLVLGYTYSKTKNLWCSILIHFSVNMSTVLLEILPVTGQLVIDLIFLASVIYACVSFVTRKNVLTRDAAFWKKNIWWGSIAPSF